MTADEKARTALFANPTVAGWIFGALFGLVPAWLMTLVFDGWPGRIAAVTVIAITAAFSARVDRRARASALADLQGGEVEVLEVETSRALELEVDHASVAPAVVLDVGDGQLLLLDGPWATDPALYGGAEPGRVDAPPWWNQLAPPLAFPTPQFTLVRLPRSGEVLSIRATGEYLAPERKLAVDLAKLQPRASELFPGVFEGLDPAAVTEGLQRRSP